MPIASSRSLASTKIVSAELFARFRKRTVGHQPLALAHPHAGRRRCRMQRSGSQILPARVEVLRELHGLHVALLPLGLVHCLLIHDKPATCIAFVFLHRVSRTASARIDTRLKNYLPSVHAFGMPMRLSRTLYRSDWGRIVATLIRLVGDFEVAEEAAQEAFAAGVNQWRCLDHRNGAAQGHRPAAFRASRSATPRRCPRPKRPKPTSRLSPW